MKIRVQSVLLGIGSVICLAEVVLAPKNSNPGPLLTAVLGILLLRRAIIATLQPAVVIASGCFLAALVVAGNHGLLNVNEPAWVGLIIVAGIGFAFWERIERLWIRAAAHRKRGV